jgi:hypothetical protein
MKNMIEICKDFGIEIPAEKHAEFNKAVAENYKTVAEHEKKVNRLSDDLAAEKKRADDAVETLKGFDGKDFEAITKERDEWKKKHDDAVAEYARQQEDREFDSAIETAITEAKGKNHKAIKALMDLEQLRGSKNRDKDIKTSLDNLRTESGYLFDDNGGGAAFADPNGNGGNNGGKTSGSDLGKLSMAEYIAARKKK